LRVLLLSPDVAARSCSDCVRYWYFDKGPGQFGDRVMRGGKPLPRPATSPARCDWCPKIAPGDAPKPENAQELSQKNLQSYVHYLECKAVGDFPDDPLVKRNAALIRKIEDDSAEVKNVTTQLGFLTRMKTL
jgi:hypothetical protein